MVLRPQESPTPPPPPSALGEAWGERAFPSGSLRATSSSLSSVVPPKVLRTPTASGQRRGGTGEGTLVSRSFVSELHSVHSLVIWRRVCSRWSRKSKCNTKHVFCGRNIGMQRWRLTWRPAWLPTRWQQLRASLRIECGLSKSRLRPTRSQLLPSLQRKSLLPRRRRSWSASSSDRLLPVASGSARPNS